MQVGQRFLSQAQAAEMLGVSVRTLRRRLADGTLTGRRFGRLIRVDVREIEAKFGVEV